MMSKYELEIDKKTLAGDIRRLINQVWKLIPMKENEEDWKQQLEIVIIEIVGLKELFHELDFLIVLSKLEGLKNTEVDFRIYRSEIFSIIGDYLGGILNGLR